LVNLKVNGSCSGSDTVKSPRPKVGLSARLGTHAGTAVT
jgi:hypothetical protein